MAMAREWCTCALFQLACLLLAALSASSRPLSAEDLQSSGLTDAVRTGSEDFAIVDATLTVDAGQSGEPVPKKLFGIFFEEINHAGVGGIDAELVRNRGFEAGGSQTPSSIQPWFPVGSEEAVWLETEPSSCFEHNPLALRMEVKSSPCKEAVGLANPGYWGMNIEQGEEYEVSFWLKSEGAVDFTVALRSQNGQWSFGEASVKDGSSKGQDWHKVTVSIKATGTDHRGQLAILTKQKGTYWLDQVSAKPKKTWKGHGLRPDLMEMVAAMKPGFVRFPGGCYVEGVRLSNAFRWRQSIGPWEDRPGHLNDVWGYWSDDGLGFYEYLQMAEDLQAEPIWVFNNGLSHTIEVDTATIGPFIKDILDGVEFARGPKDSTWGKVRAEMGHPEPFDLKYMAIGNEDCGKWNYQGNYMRFYKALKEKYPFMQLISNCDATFRPLNHPADLFDFHVYTSAANMFSAGHKFDKLARNGPKVFASEYAVVGKDAGKGTLLAAVGEAGFMIGLERNSDIVEMASYAPLFVNANDRRWNPDAIVFDSYQVYGTPSYWVQTMFKNHKDAKLLPALVEPVGGAHPNGLVGSAMRRKCPKTGADVLVVKAVNFGPPLTIQLTLANMPSNTVFGDGTVTMLTSGSIWDENSFVEPHKIVPVTAPLSPPKGNAMSVWLPPMSVNVFELPLVVKGAYDTAAEGSATS